MELATALHHSAQRVEVPREGVEGEQLYAPRRPKLPLPGKRPGLPPEPESPVRAATVGYVAAPVPLLSTPSLADTMADQVDDRAVQLLLQLALKKKKREEEREEKRPEHERRMRVLDRRIAADEQITPEDSYAWRAWAGQGGRKRLLEPLPILRFAALIVDNGSGMCWLVLLVTILFVLCFRLLSMPLAFPQVQFLVMVICPLLSCLVVLVRQCRKPADSPQLQSIAGRQHPFVPQTPTPMAMSAQQIMEIPQLLLILVVDVLAAGSCRFSGVAVEKPLALPQLQLVEKSVTFSVPLYLTVTCTVFASGLFWEMASGCFPYSELFGSTLRQSTELWTCTMLVLLVTMHLSLCSLVCRSMMLDIMAVMDQKDSQDMVPMVRLQKTVESPQLQSFQVVDISFAAQRQSLMVQTVCLTIDIHQLLYKVVDIPVVHDRADFPVVVQMPFPMVQTARRTMVFHSLSSTR